MHKPLPGSTGEGFSVYGRLTLTMQNATVVTMPPKSAPRTKSNAILLVRVAVGDADLESV